MIISLKEEVYNRPQYPTFRKKGVHDRFFIENIFWLETSPFREIILYRRGVTPSIPCRSALPDVD
jgi:hypothetical protein